MCFLCQQSVEKSLKALLTRHVIVFPKTHDLAYLAQLLAPAVPDAAAWTERVSSLTPYAAEHRYPDEWYTPSLDEVTVALGLAEAICRCCKAWLQEWLEEE